MMKAVLKNIFRGVELNISDYVKFNLLSISNAILNFPSDRIISIYFYIISIPAKAR